MGVNTMADVLTLKILMIGDSEVGKSSLTRRFAEGVFPEDIKHTIGIDYKRKQMLVDEQRVNVQLWDTAGEERYKSITRSYYRNAHAIIVVYDLTDWRSFEHVHGWMADIEKFKDTHSSGPSLVKILIGNKSDKLNPTVATEDVARLAQQYDLPFFETSAKTGANVDEAIESAVRLILKTQPAASLGTTAGQPEKLTKAGGTVILEHKDDEVGCSTGG